MAKVDIHYFNQALRCAQRQGIEREAILDQLGISLSDDAVHVDDHEMTRVVQYVWATLEDEFLGCTKSPCKRGTFPFMARHILTFPTLGQMLNQAIKCYSLMTDELAMNLQVKGDVAEFDFTFSHSEFDPDYFFREFWLIIWHRFSSWLIDEKIPLTQVSFNYQRPAHHQQLKLLFPCRHKFGDTSIKIYFSAKYLAYSGVRSQTELTQFLRRSPADLITIPGSDSSIKSQVLARLVHQEQVNFVCPTLEVLARSLNMSAQTLRRRLRSEGTSYPQIKDQIRLDLAMEYLRGKKHTISDISSRLGFSEPRSFTRAFKQWTGSSPSRYYGNK